MTEPPKKHTVTRLRQLAIEVVNVLLDDRRFHAMIRQIGLRMQVEQEQIRRLGAVRAFLSECQTRGMAVRIREDGRLVFTNVNRLTADLRAVLTLHRMDIADFLRHTGQVEAATERAMQKPANGPPAKQTTMPPVRVKGAVGGLTEAEKRATEAMKKNL